MNRRVAIIGGGLAGAEAAWQLAILGIPSSLFEMRPKVKTAAHKTSHLAELVCSNSFRSDDDEYNAVGQLHWEMRKSKGLIISVGDKTRIAAGSAMAVDREKFSSKVTEMIKNNPLIDVINQEVCDLNSLDFDEIIIATGPLTSRNLLTSIGKLTDSENLFFYDAIAPTVYADSIDFEKVWFQSRYDKGSTKEEKEAYLNCPMSKEQYNKFIDDLLRSNQSDFKEWEKDVPFFSGCLPIEEMAKRGEETLRFGPMKPVGLTNPKSKEKLHAVVQLRKENSEGTLYNLVGFQTKIKYSRQAEIFKTISGLEAARFARLGGIHKNTYFNSPKILNHSFQLKTRRKISLAGQITGVEGYIESAAIGLLVGRLVGSRILGKKCLLPKPSTALGALASHILTENKDFQPMNINFGLFKQDISNLKGRRNREKRYSFYTNCAKYEFIKWLENFRELSFMKAS